jgi:hypothetical protein
MPAGVRSEGVPETTTSISSLPWCAWNGATAPPGSIS